MPFLRVMASATHRADGFCETRVMYNYLREAGTPRSRLIGFFFTAICAGASTFADSLGAVCDRP
ncbi:hypothetical protein CUJ88_20465 [Paraburkholderia hospita]|jgi:hypothetical protein|nr:hypothetical protein CUJ88_20465 [Paraburkholderia hospita]